LRHDDLGAAPMQLGDDPVRVESLVGDEARELDVLIDPAWVILGRVG